MTDQQQPNQRDQSQRSNIPIPDPSVLTTRALDSEITHLRELLGGKVDDLARDFERFKASHGERHADAVDKAIEHLSAVMVEKFIGVQDKLEAIQRQFDERDERTRLAFEAAEKAVAAALAEREKAVQAALEASEKAGAKSEATFTKLIEGGRAQSDTALAAQQSQINDIKERLASGEGTRVAQVDTREKFSQNWGMILGAILAVIGVISLVLGVLNAGAP